MMKKDGILLAVLALFLAVFPLSAGERTIPVDMFIMIDKSLSMSDPGKFDSLHKWVRDQLIGQMLIDDDWVTIYQFYGKADNLLTMTVQTPGDRTKIVQTIDAITPNGKFTDIGLALDTIKQALDTRGTNDRLKVMLLLTDLKQEAPWTSRYAGSPDKFESPYLAEARIVPHDAWYEITLDMGIQDRVVKTSKDLFASIEETRGTAHDGTTTDDGANDRRATSGSDTQTGAAGTTGDKAGIAGNLGGKNGSGLPLAAIVVVVSGILLASVAVFTVTRYRRNRQEEENR
jgi:hypothetical protein